MEEQTTQNENKPDSATIEVPSSPLPETGNGFLSSTLRVVNNFLNPSSPKIKTNPIDKVAISLKNYWDQILVGKPPNFKSVKDAFSKYDEKNRLEGFNPRFLANLQSLIQVRNSME